MCDAFLYTYLFVVNVVAYLLYAADKHRAYYGLWRYPETLLLGIAIAGGAYGAGMGMWLFRHKTLHRAFFDYCSFVSANLADCLDTLVYEIE